MMFVMATLIVTVILGLVIAFFATQNTSAITLNFFNYVVPGIPTYVVVVGALLFGLLISWIISLINDIAAGLTIRGQDNKIKDFKKDNVELTKKIHQLELENTRLQEKTNSSPDDKSL